MTTETSTQNSEQTQSIPMALILGLISLIGASQHVKFCCATPLGDALIDAVHQSSGPYNDSLDRRA
jgi:hypothetical protein